LAQSFTSSSRSVYSGSATDSSAAHNVSSGISRDRCLRFRLTVLWVASGHDDRRLREELWRFSIGVARVLHNPWDNGVDLAAGAIASTCSAATELAQGAAPLLSAPVRWPAEGCAPHTTATPSASTERNHAAPTCVSRDGAFGPRVSNPDLVGLGPKLDKPGRRDRLNRLGLIESHRSGRRFVQELNDRAGVCAATSPPTVRRRGRQIRRKPSRGRCGGRGEKPTPFMACCRLSSVKCR
jgi:hypothetical protein